MEKLQTIRSRLRILLAAVPRIIFFIGAILMAAAVIWLAIRVFQGDVILDPDFPPQITQPDDGKDGGNFTDNQAGNGDNGGVDPKRDGSPAVNGQAEQSPGSPSAPQTPQPSQPGQPSDPEPTPDPIQPIIPILPINPPPLLDPILTPLQPLTDPILKNGLLGPVLQ